MTITIQGALSKMECDVLAACARESGATRALEVGHWQGLSTAVLLDNLPERCDLYTVDHHKGDEWIEAYPAEDFQRNVGPHIGHRIFKFLNEDMIDALVSRDWPEPFDFVFYDADHHYREVVCFWLAVRPRLAAHCTLVFDDADWEDQSVLRYLAEHDGFERRTVGEFWRGDGDKQHDQTYTLEVMVR